MTAVTAQDAPRCVPLPKDPLRIGFGIIWLIDAVLKWLCRPDATAAVPPAPESAAVPAVVAPAIVPKPAAPAAGAAGRQSDAV